MVIKWVKLDLSGMDDEEKELIYSTFDEFWKINDCDSIFLKEEIYNEWINEIPSNKVEEKIQWLLKTFVEEGWEY